MENPALFISNPEEHTMGHFLERYVTQKVPPQWTDLDPAIRRIIVTSFDEETDHNSERIHSDNINDTLSPRHPTILYSNPEIIRLGCFPSHNYIWHYASVIATYLALHGRNPHLVQPNYPNPEQAADIIDQSNLHALGGVDIVIWGDTQFLANLSDGPWEGGNNASRWDMFRFKRWTTTRGTKVALLQCLERVWGQAVQHLIKALKERSGIKCVIYAAKAGSLSSIYSPNMYIATGDRCVLDGRQIEWNNVLKEACEESTRVCHGSIITVPTTLCESHKWLSRWSSEATWVDCELGYMAEAAIDCEVDFGYLDIVSDTLNHKRIPELFNENLSNEESESVVAKRHTLYLEMAKILRHFISEWCPGSQNIVLKELL